jgi:flavin-dependent thymidylate synthase
MPDAARQGIVVSLIDAPTDPLGTLAAVCGMYEGRVARAKTEVTDDQRRAAWEAMQATVLSGPLECMQFTFLVEGVSRSIANQMTRNRFAFFAQESLRFAVADDWAQEVPLPPALAGRRSDDPLVMVWRKSLNQAEDNYAALVAAGMPAEEARGVLPLDITTRLYWTVSLRSLLTEAGKRTCTQAQFPWRQLFAGVAKAFRDRAERHQFYNRTQPGDRFPEYSISQSDRWQYQLFADAIRPVCYQTGSCGFMAKFDRGCTIRSRVDAFAAAGVPSVDWHRGYAGKGLYEFEGQDAEGIPAIDPREWAADPAAARVTDKEQEGGRNG